MCFYFQIKRVNRSYDLLLDEDFLGVFDHVLDISFDYEEAWKMVKQRKDERGK